MSEVWANASRWLVQSAVGGGLILLLVCGLMLLVRQPVRRQRLGEWGTAAALLFAVLSLTPSWLHFTYSVPAEEEALVADVIEAAPLAVPLEQPYTLEINRNVNPAEPTPAPEVVYYYRMDDARGALPVLTQPGAPAAVSAPEPALNAPEPPIIDLQQTARWLVVCYTGAALVLIVRWLIGYLWLERLVRHSRQAPEAAALLFAEMAAGLKPLPRLLVARRLRVPVSCGLFRPTVLIPDRWCSARRAAELRWVFAHELTHLQRRDSWSCLLFGLAQAVFFYLPWFWWLRRQVRLCQEFVADAAAASQPAPVEDYAQFLLSLTMAPAVPLGATGVLGNSSDLFRRVTMLLKAPICVENRCPGLWSIAVAGSLLTVAVFASGVGLRAEPVEPPQGPQKIRVRFLVDPVAPGDAQPEKRAGDRDERREAPKEGRPDKGRGDGDDPLAGQVEQLRKMLKELPAGADLPEVRRALEKALADLEARRKDVAETRRRAAEALKGVGERDRTYFFQTYSFCSRLGIAIELPSPTLADQLGLAKGEGQVVTGVKAESAAAKAGLQANDILLVLAGKSVPSDPREFAKLVEGIKAKEEVEAIVLRKGKKETVKGLTLPEQAERKPFDLVIPAPARGVAPVPGLPFQIPVPGPNMIPLPGGGQGIFQILGPPQPNAVITTTVRTAEGFTTRHQEGSLIITLTGTTKDGKNKVGEISIQDGRESHKVESLDKVPKQYQDKVKNLIELTEKGSVKIEIELKR